MNRKRLLLIIGGFVLLVAIIWAVIFFMNRAGSNQSDAVDTAPNLDEAQVTRLPVGRVDNLSDEEKNQIENLNQSILEVSLSDPAFLSATQLLPDAESGDIIERQDSFTQVVEPGEYLIVARPVDDFKSVFTSEVDVPVGEKVVVDIQFDDLEERTAQPESEETIGATEDEIEAYEARHPLIPFLPEMTETYEIELPDFVDNSYTIRLFPTRNFDTNPDDYRSEIEEIKLDAQEYIRSVGGNPDDLDLRYVIADPAERF